MEIANPDMLISHENNIDFISNLPDEVLCLIFSPLSMKEIIRTSILSRRYYLVWRHVSMLSLNPKEMVPSSQQELSLEYIACYAMRTFYNFLALHLANLKECKIFHAPYDFCLVEHWIKILTQVKHLKKLSLACTPQENLHKIIMIFPSRIFHVLDSLQLSNYAIQNDLLFYGCEMRSLKLDEVEISGFTLNSILSYCPNLEYLSLYYCTGVVDIKVHSKKLEYLEVKRIGAYSIDIHCDNLRVLALVHLICCQFNSEPKITILAPIVEKVKIYPADVDFERTDVHTADTSMYLSLLNNVKGAKTSPNYLGSVKEFRFSLALNNRSGAIALSRVLKDCSCLQVLVMKLKLTNEDGYGDLPYPAETFWDHLNNCDGVENHLRLVHLKNFSGKKLEIGLAKFLISRAKVLKELAIYRGLESTREGRQFTRGLSSMPKTSRDAILNVY